MIPKEERISQALFKAFLKKSLFTDGDFMSLRYTSSPDHIRCAIVVPKSVTKSAVKRNILRRQGYHAFKEVVVGKPKHLFAFFFKKTKKTPSYKEIHEQISFLLKKSGVYK